MVNIKYAPVSVMSKELDIDNIGDCAIRAEDELGSVYYILVSTSHGMSKTIKFGPLQGETGYEPKKSTVEYENNIYDVKKIIKQITVFLTSNRIIHAELVERAAAVEELVNSLRRLSE